ncbi:putative Fe-Mo cluster-binding NifX family protein [Rhodobium orientis]|uniref:Nitrogen fixation protein n=1 Tax=Rhodobium orientis TaxID=34017 RepID=A0A327JM58_9HYPH|nr:NifB/NifX family molybdenum-iron cluster-binding protein [Rhodobium orientis]MBB4304995.1 putative Fe-Mo cluster-binding NifX family protein [Rhodobium orientis]MBK5948797.1 nitrogen fixation protein [Rhodobium orientis]RAI26443.1 nitrogen fixation protein [Rhodobium orientis]
MRIAVTSQNFRTITPHAGKTRRFMIFLADGAEPPVVVDKLDLPKDQSIHETAFDAPHPIDVVDVVVTQSCGSGFRRKMDARGIRVVETSETDPHKAAEAVAAGRELAPAPPHDDCSH